MLFNFLITVECEHGHVQKLHMDGSFGIEWTKQMAKLLDGSSRFYLDPPHTSDSIVSRCAVCGGAIHTSVENAEPLTIAGSR